MTRKNQEEERKNLILQISNLLDEKRAIDLSNLDKLKSDCSNTKGRQYSLILF
jgi:hypothetical protein